MEQLIAELVDTNKLLESVLEHTHILAAFLDPQFNFTWVNRAYAEAGRHPPSFFPGKNHFDLYPHEENRAIFQRVVDTGEPFFVAAKPFVYPDQPERGVTYWDWSLIPVKDDGRKVTGLVFTLAEVTERVQAAEALRREREKAQMYLDLVPSIVVALDADGHVTLINDQGCRTLECERDEIIGKNWFDTFLPERVRERVRDVFDQLMTGQVEPVEYFENAVLSGKGKERTVLWHNTTVKDEAGRIVGTLAAAEDITERVRAEEALARQALELERSNAELEQFAYVISHDLREPLRVIANSLEFLEQRYQGRFDAKAGKFIGYAVDGATRMDALIKGLLAYSRVDRRDGDFESVDCEDVLNDALANLRAAVEESGAVVTHDPLPMVSADPLQLGQVFQNLVGNAIKFHGEEPPRVHVSARRDGGEWVFSIQDDGIGIDPEQAGRLFEVFRRLHAREAYPGVGMGLAICKKIVECHGGGIWVESEPGEGATFYFTIPDGGKNSPGDI